MEIRPPIRSRSAGFTLTELIITIMVMGVLLGIGIPSFLDVIRNSRLSSAANELVTSMHIARNEASKRGVQVTVCIRSGNACSTSATDWSQGWLVFTDDLAPAGQLDAPTDELLLSFQGHEVPMTGAVRAITFTPTGASVALGGTMITVMKAGCTRENKREITIHPNGRVSTVRKAC